VTDPNVNDFIVLKSQQVYINTHNYTQHFANRITVSTLNVVHHQAVAQEHNVYTEIVAECLYRVIQNDCPGFNNLS